MQSAAATAHEPKRGPGRPREFNRAQALRAALLLFWRHGFDGTSYAELTEATGMSKPTLYAAFGDKVNLFREAMVAYSEDSAAAYQEALQKPTAREAVEACLRLARGLDPTPERPKVCFLVQGALSGSADTQCLREELTMLRGAGLQMLQARLERAQREGELPAAADVAVLAEFYIAVATGLSVQAAGGSSPVQLEQVAACAMRCWPS